MKPLIPKRKRFRFKIFCEIYFLVFVFNLGFSQSESLRVIPEGIQFKDGTQQLSTSTSQNPGSTYFWTVYVSYSNGIEGDVTSAPYDEHSAVLRVHHEMYKDLNSMGVPSNIEHHRSLLLKKEIDKATTSLYNMFKNNTAINTITIKYTRSVVGAQVEKFRITLNNVKIAEMVTDMNYDDVAAKFFGYDSMRLIYQDITFQHFDPNASETISYQY